MKRVLMVIAMMVLPLSLFAMTPITDNAMSNVTGQAGVSIDVAELGITMGLNTITWGDVDGLKGAGTAEAGYVNMLVETVPMHIKINSLSLTIDVGSYTPTSYSTTINTSHAATVTAVQIGFSNVVFTLDAFAFKAIVLDSTNAVVANYDHRNHGTTAATAVYMDDQTTVGSAAAGTFYQNSGLAPATKSLGWFGFDGVCASITSGTVWIYAH